MTTPTPQVTEVNQVLHCPEIYRALMALRLEVDQSIVDHLAGVISKELTERDTLWKNRVDGLEAQIIRLKSDIAHAIGFCRGVGHPENYLEKYYPTLIPDQKEKEDV